MAYTGDPTAAQTPSPVPAADTPPIVNSVVDGSACNAASVNQQMMALADSDAFDKAPRPLAAAGAVLSNWGKSILNFRNALLQRRFGIDHQGFPGGQILQWDENWDDASSQVADLTVTSSGLLGASWSYQVTNGPGGGGMNLGPGAATRVGSSNPYPSSRLYMQVPAVGGPVVSVTTVQRAIAPIVIETAGATAISMHWDQGTNLVGLNNSSAGQVSMGMAASVLGNTNVFGVAAGLNPLGVAFMGGENVGSTNPNNWRAYVNGNGTFQTFDTGVDSNTTGVRRRFRIDIIGASVSDDATARVKFWIDGALVKSIAVDLTNGGNGLALAPFLRLWGEGPSVGSNFGPIRFRANLWPGDVFI